MAGIGVLASALEKKKPHQNARQNDEESSGINRNLTRKDASRSGPHPSKDLEKKSSFFQRDFKGTKVENEESKLYGGTPSTGFMKGVHDIETQREHLEPINPKGLGKSRDKNAGESSKNDKSGYEDLRRANQPKGLESISHNRFFKDLANDSKISSGLIPMNVATKREGTGISGQSVQTDEKESTFESCTSCSLREKSFNRDSLEPRDNALNPLTLDQEGRALLEKILKKPIQGQSIRTVQDSKLDEELIQFTQHQDRQAQKPGEKPRETQDNKQTREHSTLYIFISLSLHKNTILELLSQAKRVGGVLVLRGLKEGSWKKTIEFMLPILEEHEEGIILDPTLFKRFDIGKVPAIVLAKDLRLDSDYLGNNNGGSDFNNERAKPDSFDKISGNISIDYALRLFRKKGDLSAAADKYRRVS